MSAVKNLWAKTRPVDNPYLTIEWNGWTWKVLKAYQSRAKELQNRHSRWLCCVITPMTGPSGDWGDVYANEIPLDAAAQLVLAQRLKDEGGQP